MIWALLLYILSTIFGALGAVELKREAHHLHPRMLMRRGVVRGLVLYGAASILTIIALRYFEVSTIYPIISLTYLWGVLLARYRLGERITPARAGGVLCIIAGVLLLTIHAF